MSKGRLLLVDDEPSLRRVLSRYLVKAGFEVLDASDGVRALRLSRELPFDAVISDVRMPRMDGIELLGNLLEDDPDMPVVLVSATTELENPQDAVLLGAFDFLRKPLDLASLQSSAARAVDEHRRRRSAKHGKVA